MSQPISLEVLKSVFKRLKEQFEKGHEDAQLLDEIFTILQQVAEDPDSTIYSFPDVKRFFFEEFIGGITKRLASVRVCQDRKYLNCIWDIVNILSTLFVQGIERDNADMADAMRCIFDWNAPLHQNLFQSQNVLNLLDESTILDRLTPSDKEWRLSLQEGSKIDAIKVCHEYHLRSWAKGTIVNMIGGKHFQVQFENDVLKVGREFTIYSMEIARYNSMSAGDEWRSDLKKGDIVDGYDTTKIWYSSTILDQELQQYDGREIPYVKLGFRFYHPDGNKCDININRYYGWSDSFDEWLSAYNPRIQKYQTFQKSWDEMLHSPNNIDESCNDQADLLMYNIDQTQKQIYAIERKKCDSALLIHFLNSFGELHGFQLILDKILQKGADETIGLDLVFYYVDCIANSSIMLHRGFMHKYVKELFEAVKYKILNASELQLRNIKKDRIDQLVNILINGLKSRFMTQKQRDQDRYLLNVHIGCVFLQQNFMERRIDGAKLIHEVCKSLNAMLQSQSAETIMNNSSKLQQLRFMDQLIKVIQGSNVIFQFFSKDRIHLELVQRSEELLKLLMSQGALEQEDLELIWSCTKRGEESTKLQLYKVFVEIASKMRASDIGFIIEQLSQKTTAIKEELELVHEMARRTYKIELGKMAVEYLWIIAMESNDKQDKTLVNQAALSFSDIIKYWSIENKMCYIDRLIHNLNQNKEGFLSIKMLARIFKDFINYGTNDKIVDDLNKDEDLYSKPADSEDQDTNKNNKEEEEKKQIEKKASALDDEGNIGEDNKLYDNNSNDKKKNQKQEQQLSLLDYVNKKYDILQVFFNNFKNYMDRAREIIQKKIEENPLLEVSTLADKCLTDKFIHSDQLTERLEFLKFVSGNSQQIRITKPMLMSLWEELASGACIIQNDEEIFYRWLKEAVELQADGVCIISTDILIEFYKDITSKYIRQVWFINLEGFMCLQSLFILMNQIDKRLIKLGQTSYSHSSNNIVKLTSFNNTSGGTYNQFSFNNKKNENNSSSDPDQLDISVLVHPEELEGIESIWQIAINTKDPKVQNQSAELLIKLYTCIAYRNEPSIPQFEDCYLMRCMTNIKSEYETILARKEEQKEELVKVEKQIMAFSISTTVTIRVLPLEERRIVRIMSLIKELIKNSEKDGTWGVKPHSALFRGEYLGHLQINNSIKQGEKYKSIIELGCYSNITLWELRKLIGQSIRDDKAAGDNAGDEFIPVHPFAIRLYRHSGSVDLKEYENGKTLADLKFKHNENISAFKKQIYSTVKEPLLNEFHNDISDRAKSIFKSWFHKFSIPDPDPEYPNRRIMTPTTCAAFARTCTDDYVTEEDGRVVGLFTMYDTDRDKKLTEENFLQFYKTCCLEKEEVVRQNLFNHEYRYDLKQFVKDTDPEFLMQIRSGLTEMPRYKMASNQEYFDLIFKLMERQGEMAQQAWSLVKTISTNHALYWKVLKLNKEEGFEWSQIFDKANIYKMLYSLQIVESLLEKQSSTSEHSTTEDLLKKDWIQRFLELDGFQQILKLFHNSIDILGAKSADVLNKFEKNFLEFMLRLIKIFMMAAFSQSSSQQNAFEVLSLAKKQSSIKEEIHPEHKDDKDNRIADQESYKTPSKQFKPTEKYGLAEGGKKLYDDSEYQPEINEAALFGESDQQIQQQIGPVLKDQASGQTKNEENSSNKKKGDNHEDIANDMERFSELIKVMKDTGLGEIILSKIDFTQLQNQVLEIVCLMLQKKEIIIEDKLIVESALSLWVASVLKNETLIDQFYEFKRSEEKAGRFGIKNAEELLVGGLYCYKNNEGRLPLLYMLNLMRNNFPKEDQYYATRECKQFFDLFSKLVEEYFTFAPHPKFESDAIDGCHLLKEVVEKLKRHETKEKKTSLLEDKTLIGYMDLVKVCTFIFMVFQKLINYLSTTKDKEKMLVVLDDCSFLREMFYEQLFYSPEHTKTITQNKCKTKESRIAAFQLLTKYIDCLDPVQTATFLDDYLWPMLKDARKPKKWCYTPSDCGGRSSNFVGIVNLGCICYMNSMLQQFFMVPAFRYQLLRAIDSTPEDIVEYKGLRIDDSLLRQLQKLFGYLELSERGAYDPTDFCFAFKDIEGNPTNTALQQDAQEFLSIFFDRVEELLRPTSQKHLLNDVFGFKLCSQLICQSCGNIRNLLENQYTLSLQVKDRKGVEDSLHKLIEGSIINDFKCEACNQKTDVFKRNLIAETPNVLILHLQRIVFNFDTFQNDKINSRFEFPPILSLKDFSFREVMKNEGRPKEIMYSDDMKHLMDIKDEEYTYKLVGVNIHVGTAEHGHYYSLINTKRGSEELEESKMEWTQTEKDPWKCFEDDKIKLYSYSDLKSDSFGGTAQTHMNDSEMNAYITNTGGSFGKNAYMLVYERMKKKQLTEIITEDPSAATLDCSNTATSREATNQQTQITSHAPNERLVDFRKVTQYVPDWIKTMILEDNSSHLIDQHLFSDGFFNMVKSVFKHISDHVLLVKHRYGLEFESYFTRVKRGALKMAGKSMFDVLAYSFHNTSMSDITSTFGSIIQFCDSHYSLARGDDSLLAEFIKEYYLADNCQAFFNIMFNCTDKTSRFYIGRLTAQVINKAFNICQKFYEVVEQKEWTQQMVDQGTEKIKDLQECAEKVLYMSVIALQTSDCQKSWSRLEQYFKFLYECATTGPLQTHFLLTKFDIIVDLIDFMLGNKSPMAIQKGEKRPNMGAGMSSPPFEHLVALVSYLIRFSLTPKMKKEESSWNDTYNPVPHTLLGYTLKQQENQIEQQEQQQEEEVVQVQEKYPLSEVVFNFFTYQDFIDKVLKEGYQCEEFGKALAHFCYKNESFSKRVAKMLLRGISKNDYDKVRNFLDVVIQVALIQDELQRTRLEWMFGIQLLNSSATYRQNDTFDVENNTTKIGIQNVTSLSYDEIYQYKSSLLPPDSDDALLNLLWRYKGRIDSYTVNCLQSLIYLLSLDEKVCEYFSQLPGPTYCYARYTDWIKPYLHEQLLDARKGYHGSLSQSKEESVVKALSLYDKYQSFLQCKDKTVGGEIHKQEVGQEGEEMIELRIKESVKEKQESQEEEKIETRLQDGYQMVGQGEESDVEENVRNLIVQTSGIVVDNSAVKMTTHQNKDQQSYTIIPCEPRPYMIIECTGTEQIREQNFDGVVLGIAQLSCLYTMSYPTGHGNLSVPTKLFAKGLYKNVQNDEENTRRANNREKEMQNSCIGNKFESHKLASGQYDVASTQVNSDAASHAVENLANIANMDNQNNQNVDYGNRNMIKDNDDQWKYVENQNSDEEGDRMNNISSEEELKGSNVYDDQTPLFSSNQIQVVEYKEQEQDQVQDMQQVQTSINVDAKQNLEQIDEEEQVFENPSQINWPYGVNKCADLVYKFYIINTRPNQVKCTLRLSEIEQQPTPNLQFPRGGVRVIVNGLSTKTVILLPKIIPKENELVENQLSEGKKKVRMETDALNIQLFWKSKNFTGNQAQGTQDQAVTAPLYEPEYHQTSSNSGTRRPGIRINLGEINSNMSHVERGTEYPEQDQQQVFSSETGIVSNDTAVGCEVPPGGGGGQKQCQTCTTYNDVGNAFCESCYADF